MEWSSSINKTHYSLLWVLHGPFLWHYSMGPASSCDSCHLHSCVRTSPLWICTLRFRLRPSSLHHYQSRPCTLAHWRSSLVGGLRKIHSHPPPLDALAISGRCPTCRKHPPPPSRWRSRPLLESYWTHNYPAVLSRGLPTSGRTRGHRQGYSPAFSSCGAPPDSKFFNWCLRAYRVFFRQLERKRGDFKKLGKTFSIIWARLFQRSFCTNPWSRRFDWLVGTHDYLWAYLWSRGT